MTNKEFQFSVEQCQAHFGVSQQVAELIVNEDHKEAFLAYIDEQEITGDDWVSLILTMKKLNPSNAQRIRKAFEKAGVQVKVISNNGEKK